MDELPSPLVKRSLLVLNRLIVLLVVAAAALAAVRLVPVSAQDTAPAAQAPPPSGAPQAGAPTAGAPPMRRQMPPPSNLQVLPKDYTGADVMKVMHKFEAEVGIECGFCHATDATTHRLNFASDEKPEKATARVMMRMTADINAKYLTQINDPDHADHPAPPVTCGTCHRGHSMPEMFMPPPEEHHDMPGMQHDHPAPPPPA